MTAKLPAHLFVSSCDGALYDTRGADWSKAAPLRAVYRMTYQRIDSAAQFKSTLRAGAYAWPGGYPLYFITSDCAALCFPCARKECRNVLESISTRANDGWRIVATDINYEDSELTCDHCSKSIEAAYADEPKRSPRRTARFWVYHKGGDVRIKIKPAQYLHHSSGGATDEGYSRESNRYHFDGETVTCEWSTDSRDCDGRMSRSGESYCAADRLTAGYQDKETGLAFPDWQEGAPTRQRDYSAEAAGY